MVDVDSSFDRWVFLWKLNKNDSKLKLVPNTSENCKNYLSHESVSFVDGKRLKGYKKE